MDSKYVRRDQIWIVDKDNYGSSNLYRITDSNVRNDKKLMKSYLLGQFGSVPDINKGATPLEIVQLAIGEKKHSPTDSNSCTTVYQLVDHLKDWM